MSIIDGLQNANQSYEKLLGRALTTDERKALMYGFKCGMIEATNDSKQIDSLEEEKNV